MSLSVSEFINSAEPFDLIVFERNDIASKIIEAAESISIGKVASITHVGVVVMNLSTELPNKLLWESYYSDKFFGVHTRPLEEVIVADLHAGSKVGLCKLMPAVREIVAKLSPSEISECFDSLNHRVFNVSPIDLIAAAFPILRPLREKINSKMGMYATPGWMFSSEFVAACYIKLGVINDLSDGVADGRVLNPKDFIPNDFVGTRDHEVTDIDGLRPFVAAPLWLNKN